MTAEPDTADGGKKADNRFGGLISTAARLYPGVAVSTVFGIAAFAISVRYGAPGMLIALLVGLAGHFLYDFDRIRPGVDWTARTILRLGVALLGLRIAFADLIAIGIAPIMVVLLAMVITIVGGIIISRSLGLSREFGALSSGSVAVCGVSAAIAISTVLPKKPESERDLAVVVAGVTTLSTIAMIIYPLANLVLHLSDHEMGIVLGGSIHDVAQVVGAGYSISHDAGDTATIVKLMRVSALLLVVIGIYSWIGRQDATASGTAGGGRVQYLPTFLIGFFVLAAINSMHWAPPAVVKAGVTTSQWLLLISIAAIGIKTNLRKIAEVGWKPVIALVAQTLIMLVVVVLGVFMLRWMAG
ncbi:MAG: putative sulfate exporter family transporter [Hyphomonas sp.]|uniref:YeiH family protein n=1 Tax=Hyphomonas sp. TaxID=87 RepID=UPI003526CB5F